MSNGLKVSDLLLLRDKAVIVITARETVVEMLKFPKQVIAEYEL